MAKNIIAITTASTNLFNKFYDEKAKSNMFKKFSLFTFEILMIFQMQRYKKDSNNSHLNPLSTTGHPQTWPLQWSFGEVMLP